MVSYASRSIYGLSAIAIRSALNLLWITADSATRPGLLLTRDPRTVHYRDLAPHLRFRLERNNDQPNDLFFFEISGNSNTIFDTRVFKSFFAITIANARRSEKCFDENRGLPISSDSYLGSSQATHSYTREGRKERKRMREAYVTNASSCKQNDVLGGWGERRIILRSTMSSDYSYFVPLVLIRGDTPVQAAIMSAIWISASWMPPFTIKHITIILSRARSAKGTSLVCPWCTKPFVQSGRSLLNYAGFIALH